MNPRPRPLSPHLQVYRWQVQMVSSILHRATGIVLSLAFATYLLGADSTLAAERSLPVVYVFQFLAAVPLLIVLAGPLYLRCWRRGLEQEIELRERRREE